MQTSERAKLGALVLTAVGSIGLAFFLLDAPTAVAWVRHGGYWLLLLNLLLLLFCLVRAVPSFRGVRGFKAWIITRRHPLTFIAVVSGFMLLQQPAGFKIVMDEPVIASTALRMHEHRQVMTTARAHSIEGVFTQLDGYVDKRPYFYPFLVSLLHDFTGYRSINAVVLNHLLLPILLYMVYLLGDRASPGRGGYLAVGLCGTLPLLGMAANGGGLGLLNLVMLLLCFFAAEYYIKRPDTRRGDILILVCMLLAQTRYESILFAFPTGLVLLMGWFRARRPLISWVTVISPIFLIPYGLQRELFEEEALAYELREGSQAAFSFTHVPGNLRAAADFFFNFNTTTYPNSSLISLLFVGALVLVLVAVLCRTNRWRELTASGGAVPALYFLYSSVILFNMGLLMSYHWGQLNDIMAARIALPFILLQTLLSVAILLRYFPSPIFYRGLCVVSVLFLVGFTLPSNAKNDYLQWVPGHGETVWVQTKAKEYQNDKVLFITDRNVAVITERVPAVAPMFVKHRKSRLNLLMQLHAYDEIFVVFRYIEDASKPGTYRTDWPVYKDFELEIIEKEKLGKWRYICLARISAVKMLAEDGGVLPSLRKLPESKAEKTAFIAELLP